MYRQTDLVAGRYEAGEPLGSGGMATVWRAWDGALQRPVALKRLHPHLAAQHEAAARFRLEASAAGGLSHPGIVTVHDAGVDGDGPYLVMELVEGETLADRLRREGRLDPSEAARIAAAVAEALHHAHLRGVVHRDVKPGNVLLGPDGRVRVADFGIARSRGTVDRITGGGLVMGTAAYLSPEQAGGDEAGPAADLYALGVVLYEMLTGQAPFRGESPMAVALAHRHDAPEPPGKVVPLDPGLEALVMSTMSKQPGQRPASGEALASALRPYSRGTIPIRPLDPRPTLPPRSEQPTAVTVIDRPASTTPRHAAPAERAGVARWGAVGGLAALVVAVAFLFTGDELPRQAGPASTPPTTRPVVAVASSSPPTTAPSTTTTSPTTSAVTAPDTPAGAVAALLTTMDEGRRAGDVAQGLRRRLHREARRALREWEKGDDGEAAELLVAVWEGAVDGYQSGDIGSRDSLDDILRWTEYAGTLMSVFERNGDGGEDEGDN